MSEHKQHYAYTPTQFSIKEAESKWNVQAVQEASPLDPEPFESLKAAVDFCRAELSLIGQPQNVVITKKPDDTVIIGIVSLQDALHTLRALFAKGGSCTRENIEHWCGLLESQRADLPVDYHTRFRFSPFYEALAQLEKQGEIVRVGLVFRTAGTGPTDLTHVWRGPDDTKLNCISIEMESTANYVRWHGFGKRDSVPFWFGTFSNYLALMTSVRDMVDSPDSILKLMHDMCNHIEHLDEVGTAIFDVIMGENGTRFSLSGLTPGRKKSIEREINNKGSSSLWIVERLEDGLVFDLDSFTLKFGDVYIDRLKHKEPEQEPVLVHKILAAAISEALFDSTYGKPLDVISAGSSDLRPQIKSYSEQLAQETGHTVEVVSTKLSADNNTLTLDLEIQPAAISPKILAACGGFSTFEEMTEYHRNPRNENPEWFLGYFTDEVEYPQNKLDDILPVNTMWSYVSSQFLNGLVNYGETLDVFVLNRYVRLDQILTEEDDGPFGKWKENGSWRKPDPASVPNFTKEFLLNLYSKGREVGLGSLIDDVLVLQKIADGFYIYFWFDKDVSDCVVGRFRTENSEETVRSLFEAYAHERSQHFTETNAFRMPLESLEGWKSF